VASWVSLFVDHDLERDAAVASVLLVLLDVFRVGRLADDLDQDARLRIIQLDEDQRTHVGSALIEEGEEGHVDARLGIVGDLADVVFVGRVFPFAFQFQISQVTRQLGHKLEDLVHLDGEAGRSLRVPVLTVDAVIHDALVLRDEELAGFAVLGRAETTDTRLGAIREFVRRLSFHVSVGRVVGVEEIVDVVDVFGVRRGIRFLVLDEGLGFVGSRAEAHAGVRWQHRVRSRQQRSLVIGEGVEKDGEEAGEEGGETDVVDQVEKADFAPRRRGPGEDGARLAVVNQVARTHRRRRQRIFFLQRWREICFFLSKKTKKKKH